MKVTRRRTLQGAGAVGVVGLAGNVVVAADEDANGALEQVEQQDGAALRVAHASPDTPSVEVRLVQAGGIDTPGPDGADETETPGDGAAGGADDPLIEDLGFRDVSDYTDVEPGTYRLQIVATGESGILDGIFGDDGGQERVISDERVEIQAGTTYTAVAYGELARADLGESGAGTADGTPGGTGAGAGGQETPEAETPGVETPGGGAAGDGVLVEGLAFGDYEYVELDAGDHTLEFRESRAGGDDALGTATTPGVDGTTPEDGIGGGDDELTPGDDETTPGDETLGEDDDRAFQVEVLEDELSVTGAGATGTPGGEETPGDDALGGEETPGDGAGGAGDQELSRLRIFHAVPDVDAMTVALADQGDGDGGILDGGEETPDGQTPTDAGGAGGTGDARVREAEISPEGGSVYSGFGTGYFDPEAAGDGAAGGGDGTPGAGTPTGDGGETPTGTEDGELTEDVSEANFEFVTVEDATDGERSDGGTGDGLFSSIEPARASSD